MNAFVLPFLEDIQEFQGTVGEHGILAGQIAGRTADVPVADLAVIIKAFQAKLGDKAPMDKLAQLFRQNEFQKLELHIKEGNLPQEIDAIEQKFADSGAVQFNGGLHVPSVVDGRSTLVPLGSMEAVRDMAGRLIDCTRNDKDGGKKKINFPTTHAGMMHKRGYYHLVPECYGLARNPIMLPDWTIKTSQVLDPKSKVLCIFDAKKYKVPATATKEEALAALGRLRGWGEEFPFAAGCDESAFVAAMVTAVLRPALPTAVGSLISAPEKGSGKSTAAETIAALAADEKVESSTWPNDDIEQDKVLGAMLLDIRQAVIFDNLTRDVDSAKLCTILSAPLASLRILGQSKQQKVVTRLMYLFTGNGVHTVADLKRRILEILLDAQMDTPAARTFKRTDLVGDVLRDRHLIVWDVLTIMVAYRDAGLPDVGMKSLAGFKEWQAMCCAPLIWLGMEDPLTRLWAGLAEDPEKVVLAGLLDEVLAIFGTAEFTIKELVAKTEIYTAGGAVHQHLKDVLIEIAGDKTGAINVRILAAKVRKQKGRVIGTHKIVMVEGNAAIAKWKIEKIGTNLSKV